MIDKLCPFFSVFIAMLLATEVVDGNKLIKTLNFIDNIYRLGKILSTIYWKNYYMFTSYRIVLQNRP